MFVSAGGRCSRGRRRYGRGNAGKNRRREVLDILGKRNFDLSSTLHRRPCEISPCSIRKSPNGNKKRRTLFVPGSTMPKFGPSAIMNESRLNSRSADISRSQSPVLSVKVAIVFVPSPAGRTADDSCRAPGLDPALLVPKRRHRQETSRGRVESAAQEIAGRVDGVPWPRRKSGQAPRSRRSVIGPPGPREPAGVSRSSKFCLRGGRQKGFSTDNWIPEMRNLMTMCVPSPDGNDRPGRS